jgi:hypothetical protein
VLDGDKLASCLVLGFVHNAKATTYSERISTAVSSMGLVAMEDVLPSSSSI